MLPWVNYANETCRLFLHRHIQKLGWFSVIYPVRPIHFVREEFVLASTAPYIVRLLKVHCHSVSLGKLCKRNMWIIPPLLFSNAKAFKISKSLLGFQVKILDFQQFIDPCMAFYLG